ncbi:hypothetical protein AGMMS49921_02350 [Endomicrobiia bacterium]|nr:hypothetical protein AGMMS49921_02350 [Endomicrobiia bacterium]
MYFKRVLSLEKRSTILLYIIPDFSYKDKITKEITVEDVKGVKTPVYNVKKKIFLRIYGETVDFKEI